MKVSLEKAVRSRIPEAFCQEMKSVSTALGLALYIRIRRRDDKPMSWSEIWAVFNDMYPGQWACEFFPPAEELVDEANVYHLYVLEEAPRGFNIRRN